MRVCVRVVWRADPGSCRSNPRGRTSESGGIIALFWNGFHLFVTRLFETRLFEAGAGQVWTLLRTGDVSRPVILIFHYVITRSRGTHPFLEAHGLK